MWKVLCGSVSVAYYLWGQGGRWVVPGIEPQLAPCRTRALLTAHLKMAFIAFYSSHAPGAQDPQEIDCPSLLAIGAYREAEGSRLCYYCASLALVAGWHGDTEFLHLHAAARDGVSRSVAWVSGHTCR